MRPLARGGHPEQEPLGFTLGMLRSALRVHRFPLLLGLLAGLPWALSACSADDAGGGGGGQQCPTEASRFPTGDANGHADPYGAKAAGQARAGRLLSEAQLVQPAHGRQKVRVGDFVLVNDKLAVTIEDRGLSDGYARFGGEILAIDAVGDDGRPRGWSRYQETLMALSIEMIDPESVSVLNDGSNGQAAVVRVTGPLRPIPFLNGSLGVLFPRRYGLQAAVDYVLEPGKEALDIRLGILNPASEPVSFAPNGLSDEMHGFFQYNMSRLVTSTRGFGKARGEVPFVGFVSDERELGFAWRLGDGAPLSTAVEISGFQYFTGPGFSVEGCSEHWEDHVQVVAGGPDYDGLAAAIRRVDGVASRGVSGTVRDTLGAAVAGARVHGVAEDGSYVTRALTDASGRYALSVPADASVRLEAVSQGYPPSGAVEVPTSQATADLTLGATGVLAVHAVESGSLAPLPVRVQVIPEAPVAELPASYGEPTEEDGRLWLDFPVSGEARLRVPPGNHRVVVSRGSEWELLDTTVGVAAGQTVDIPVQLEHSVDTTGVMCADFHVHSAMSADSSDPVELKVRAALGDGLDIPVSSEHEWIIDFQPVIEQLGAERWAFGMPSEELTTFTWGHFGVVPLTPRPDALNNGAIEWIGKLPPEMFTTVRQHPEQPLFIINHPSGGGFGAYFSAAGFDKKTATASREELWSTEFDAIEVFNGSDFEANRRRSVADWFALLNAGFTFWATGASDSHGVRTDPVGYPRTCLQLGTDDPTQLTGQRVRDAMAQGRAIVSGGLFMTVSGPGGAGPGGTLQGPLTEADFTVTVQAPSWLDATTLEVIVNGETQLTEPLLPLGAGTGKRWVNQVRVQLDRARPRSWVVFHARGEGDLAPVHPGRGVFAVSNPVFIAQ